MPHWHLPGCWGYTDATMENPTETSEPVEPDPPSGRSADTDSQEASGEGATLAQAAGDGEGVDPAAEKELWVGRTHWKHYAGRILLWVAANATVAIGLVWLSSKWDALTGSTAFWIITALLVVSGGVVLGRVAYRIIGHRYRLTSQRLFISRGILSQTIDQTELIRVDDVRVHRTLLDRIFGLGTVAIVSTDATDREIVIEGIAESDRIAEAIRGRMRTMRRKSLFVENL